MPSGPDPRTYIGAHHLAHVSVTSWVVTMTNQFSRVGGSLRPTNDAITVSENAKHAKQTLLVGEGSGPAEGASKGQRGIVHRMVGHQLVGHPIKQFAKSRYASAILGALQRPAPTSKSP